MMRSVVVAMIIIMRMVVIMSGASFAESTVGATMVVICEVYLFSLLAYP
jgi:hypothetical protein